jgi:hypothetical protein
MKKPLRGDQLTIRYEGALLRARCDEVADAPKRGAGAVSFTIVSQTGFVRGREAHLIQGASELPVQVERVSVVGHRRINIVMLGGVFDTALAPVGAAPLQTSVPAV